jgi:hypothetical protein
MRIRPAALLSLALILAATAGISADVKTQQKTQLKMEGMLGKVAGMFGGKAMKEGVTTTIAVKGNRRMSTNDTTAELVDIDAEKVYRIDLKGKSYTVQTFEEIRREFEKMMAKAEAQTEKKPQREGPEMEFDIDIKQTGQQKAMAGTNCDQVILTLGVHEKGKTIDDAGGMVITSDMWMAPKNPALQEYFDFEMRYMQKVYGDKGVASAKDLAQAMAMYPGMKDAMARLQSEGRKLSGTPMQTTVTMAAASGPDGGNARAEKSSGSPVGLGALGGLLGRKKKAEPPAEGAAASPGAKTRATILTTVTEVLSIDTSVAGGDVEIPAGFKQK